MMGGTWPSARLPSLFPPHRSLLGRDGWESDKGEKEKKRMKSRKGKGREEQERKEKERKEKEKKRKRERGKKIRKTGRTALRRGLIRPLIGAEAIHSSIRLRRFYCGVSSVFVSFRQFS
jgi:hypothetical protein